MKGIVYILSNPSMPGLVKIGCTARPVEDRLNELNAATGVPSPFKVEAYFETEKPQEDEARVHKRLDKHRIEGKEFFRLSVAEALAIARSVLGVPSERLHGAWEPAPQLPPGTYSCGLCKNLWQKKAGELSCPMCGSSAIVCLRS